MWQVYEGDWTDGKQHGQGVLRRKDGSVIHDGEWVDDEPVRSKEAQGAGAGAEAEAEAGGGGGSGGVDESTL